MNNERTPLSSLWAVNFGNIWVLVMFLVFPIGIYWGLAVNSYYEYNIFLIYFLTACGTVFSTIIFLIIRPYPFTGDMVSIHSTNNLTEEERKILTFWKTSSCMNNLVIKTGCFLLLFLLFMLVLCLFYFKGKNLGFGSASVLISLGIGLGCAVTYFIFSISIFIFILARYLLKNIDKIKKMEIEPWSLNKPYTPGPFNQAYLKKEPKLSIFTEILNFDPKTPFNWVDFWALIMFFVSFVLFWSGIDSVGRRQHVNYSMIAVKIILSIVTFYVGKALWRKKLKK